MSLRLEEPLPDDPVEAEAVLHVRRDLRRKIRATRGDARRSLLAMLFGVPARDEGLFADLDDARDPIARAASIVADETGVARLGHDEGHVEACRLWLLHAKESEEAFDDILAFDLATLLALDRARSLARSGAVLASAPVPVLIRGETGTGKELLTKAIHHMSGRPGKLVPLHVAGMPDGQIYSTLFGHVQGAYTGAIKDRKGLLEVAEDGTVHLDEVGDLPAQAQVGLLRVLQDGVYTRLGDDRTRTADVRIIAATWRDLRTMIEEDGGFRRDLYHRICVSEVFLPPLRDRTAGFRELVRQLLARMSPGMRIIRSALDALAVHDWPGNLRELDGALRVAVSSAVDGLMRLEDLPPPIQARYLREPVVVRGPGILCDHPDGLEVEDASISDRISVLVDAISSATPLPEPAVAAQRFLEVMAGLPDGSGGHAQVLGGLVEAQKQALRAQQETQIAAQLAAVAAADELPQAAVVATKAAATVLQAKAGHTAAQATAAWQRVDLRASPWGRLFIELTELPVLQGQNHVEILGFVKMVILLTQSVDPGVVDHLRERLSAGGLTAIREWARLRVIDASAVDLADDKDEITLPPGPPKSWSAEQWRPLLDMVDTREELGVIVGKSGKTVKKYLDAVGVEPPWAR